MKKVRSSSSSSKKSFSRRGALKGAAGLASFAAVGAGCGPAGVSADGLDQNAGNVGGRKRVAVVGGGAGGVAAAYFLEGICDVEIFEARAKIGGHCDSQTVDYQGQPITVDLGAQFFHPATHPIYVTLLEELGLYDPDHADADFTIEAPGSVCIFPTSGGAPVFTSTNPFATPFRAIDFALFTQYARQAVLLNTPWELTLNDWINLLPVSIGFKNDVLRPWISSLIGSNRSNAMRSSARSILQTFALAFPANILAGGATTFNSNIGLEGNLQRMLDRAPSARVHVSSAVQSLSRAADGAWTIGTEAGSQGPFDAVVLNAPPGIGKTLVRALPWAAEIATLLDTYEYFDARLVIHTDAAYVHADRANWAAYNAGVDGIECEGSVWLGGFHEKLPTGATVDVFKSWAQRRRADPTNILLERRFRHPLITKGVIKAARALRAFQGTNNLYLSGQYTTGFDLQESAVYSAIKVAEKLAPGSSSLASLQARLTQRGRSGISYDL